MLYKEKNILADDYNDWYGDMNEMDMYCLLRCKTFAMCVQILVHFKHEPLLEKASWCFGCYTKGQEKSKF